MLYCTKCCTHCEDGLKKCPNCKSGRNLRVLREEDEVLLHRMDVYTADCLAARLQEESVYYRVEPFGKGMVSYLYDSDVLPTDKNFYVHYADLAAVSQIAAQVERQVEKERYGEPEKEEFEEMPRRKRIIVQIVSVLAFLLLVMAAVFGADAFANWLKSLF